MRRQLILITLIATSMIPVVSAQDKNTPRCLDLPLYHVLDFWVGEWNVYVGDERVGYNRIEKTLNGCAIHEHWTDLDGNEGKSLFFVDDRGLWQQIWVTEWANRPGGVKQKTIVDIRPQDGVRFQGVLYHPDVGEWSDRTTLKAVDNGEVRQIIETSSDSGKTWKTGFDAIYRRVSSE